MKSLIKNILVTGNLGYIGTVLTEELISRQYKVTGFDIDYYQNCDLYDYVKPDKQIIKDIRDVSKEDLSGVDAIIHLAALSNDPLGEFNPSLTEDINLKATVRLAKIAKEKGIKRFVYSSSQSMYGISSLDEELDENNSEKNPITAYAATKWQAECILKDMCSDDFIVTCFRPSTVFGASPKLRCDIVFNNLTACAYTTGKIEIKSDGTPWRPVVHVRDVCKAFIAGIEAPKELIYNKSFNVGIPDGNFTVKDLAEAVRKVLPDSEVTYSGEHGKDSRTYKVSFNRILKDLKDYYQPEWDLEKGGKELIELFERINFNGELFKGKRCNRLKALQFLVVNNSVDNNLKRTDNDI